LTQNRRALVIGAGLAGCATARALARRGWSVTVVAAAPGPDASDVPAAVLAPPPLPGNDPVTAFRYRAGRIARVFYDAVERAAGARARLGDGVLLVPKRARDHLRIRHLGEAGHGPVRVDAVRASALSGADLDSACIHHPRGGWYAPPSLRSVMLAHPRVEIAIEAHVARVRRHGGHWSALDDDGNILAAAPVCVVAAGIASPALLPAISRSLVAARGQATAVVDDGRLRMGVSGNGYAVPDGDGRLWLGATITRDDDDPRPRDADDERNLAVFGRLWPHSPLPRAVARFAGVRATTRDRLPLAGELDDGLWINAGHGTQGLLSAPLTALLLARSITAGRSHPLLARMHPERHALAPRTTPAATALS